MSGNGNGNGSYYKLLLSVAGGALALVITAWVASAQSGDAEQRQLLQRVSALEAREDSHQKQNDDMKSEIREFRAEMRERLSAIETDLRSSRRRGE